MASTHGGFGVRGWGRSTARSAIGLAVAVALASAGCSKNNADFCQVKDDCDVGQECSSNACIDSADATPAPDASPTCPAESHRCVPLAPADWSGPTMRAVLAPDDGIPACAITDPGGLVAGAGFDSDGSCECTCSTAATITCTAGRVDAVPGPGGIACTQEQCSGGCENQTLPANTCISRVAPQTPQPNLRFRAGDISGGTCEPGTLSAVAPAADFEERVALCQVEIGDGDCGVEAACAALPAPGFSATSCIFREGDHACPAGFDFTERTLSFTRLDDGRVCDACECDLPVGSSCKGGVEGFASGICSGSSLVSEGLGCSATSTWEGVFGFRYEPIAANIECAPTDANPGVTGEITGVDPITVCCTAAP